MDIQLLKQLGNITQLAGIRQSVLAGGQSLAEFYNAAGLRFTVLPDRCMDIYELSYRGINLSFHSKNGLRAGGLPLPQAFCDDWPGGMLYTCGLDNVGGGYVDDAIYPTHGRISGSPAMHFSAQAYWQNDTYTLTAKGDMHQTRLYGRHLCLTRSIRTSLYAKSLHLNDTLTNLEPADEPFMLLYHFNFGYPLLHAKSLLFTSSADMTPRNALSTDPRHMRAPQDGRGEEFYLYRAEGESAWGLLVNPELELGAYIAFDTANLPYFAAWKNMRSHDYVLAIEPCNCIGAGRKTELASEQIARIQAYGSLSYDLELGVLDGKQEIRAFLEERGTAYAD